MRLFLKTVSYLFHPILIPLAGTLGYFAMTPKYSPFEVQSATVLPVLILTIIIPLIAYLILKNLGMLDVTSPQSLRKRKYLLCIEIGLLAMVTYKVLPNNYIAEVYYYFVGLIAASLAALLLLFLNFRGSLHLMGLGSLLLFLTSLSIHFEINITLALSFLTLVTGIVATAQLYHRTESRPELFIGFCLGALTQLLTLKFWL